MAHPLNIKTEGLLVMDIHNWSPSSSSSSSSSKIAIPQAYFPQYSEVPVAKIVRHSRKLEEAPMSFDFSKMEPFVHSPMAQGDDATPKTPTTPSDSDNISPSDVVERIPRPPNAFMLFRSHFLKEGHIPKTVEKRQQNLSRVAGEVWGLMPEDEKRIWHTKAAEKLREHKLMYPNYKFIPSPRGTRRNKDKVPSASETATTAQQRTQHLREKYTKFSGPSPVSSRKRRPKKDRTVGSRGSNPFLPLHSSLPNSPFSTPPPSPSKVKGVPHTPENMFYVVGQQFPRRPSTSLGFNEHHSAQQSSGSLVVADNNNTKRFTGAGFLNFGSARSQEDLANTQSIDASSTWTFDHAMIGGSQQSILHEQIAGPFPPPPANISSSIYDYMPQQSNVEGHTDLFLGNVSGGANNDHLCDPAFFNPMGYMNHPDTYLLPAFSGNPAVRSSDNQDSQDQFDASKWSDFGTNPFLSQLNDTGYHMN